MTVAHVANGKQLVNDVCRVLRPDSDSPWLVICEHASHDMPAEYEGLGLAPEDRYSHIAWDPGAAAVSEALGEALGATVVLHRWSRLLYDCNRPPESLDTTRETSEDRPVPGNVGLDIEARRARLERFYRPFHHTIEYLLDERALAYRPTAIINVHSFTPVYLGVRRDVELGIINERDDVLGLALHRALAGSGLDVRLDEPYSVADNVTHTARRHATVRTLPSVMLEIRNDLIDTPAQQRDWGVMLGEAFASTDLGGAAATRWLWPPALSV